MSDARIVLRGLTSALTRALACALLAAAPLAAQDDDVALAERLAETRARQQAIEVERRALARRPAAPIDTTWIDAAPLRVGMLPRPLPALEQASVRRGIARGLALVSERHGAAGRALIDTVPWFIGGNAGRYSVLEPVMFFAGSQDVLLRLRRPVDEDRITQAVLDHVASRLRRVAPGIVRYVGDPLTLSDDDARFEATARELAVAWASPARRCYEGHVADCRRVVSTADSASALATWFDATDHRGVVVVGSGDISLNDRLRRDRRERCVNGGDDTACTQLATTLPVRNPYSKNIRATLVREAFALGDTAMIERLRAATGTDPVEVLAQAAGVSVDSLLASWVSHSRTALDDGRGSAPLLLLCAVGWSALLLAFIGRRRPA